MNEATRAQFEESICDCFALYETEPKDLDVWWSACHRYELQDIVEALAAHVQNPQWGNTAPKPAQIVGRLARSVSDGHLPADEAWAIAIQAMDESETVVWTQQIAEAWGAACLIMRNGDEVGARMAFKAAYERRVANARADGLRPKWFPSLGHDPEKRSAALAAAADRLRLPHIAEQAAIEDQNCQPPSAQVRAWIAEARLVMLMQAPRPENEIPLDEIVVALPKDRDGRRRALAKMTPSMERRVRHVLGEAERKRQLDELYCIMTPEERAEYERVSEQGS